MCSHDGTSVRQRSKLLNTNQNEYKLETNWCTGQWRIQHNWFFFLNVVYSCFFSPLCFSVTILTSFLSKRACGTAACCEAVLLTSASRGRCCYVTVAGQPGSQAVVQHGTNHRFQLPVQAQQIHGWERKKAIERERERKKECKQCRYTGRER